ncbi:hypothetical protein LCGC14_1458320 [marine sediment metagenome]|uniref:Uncharacterized protein n=1 Tax=marine sediment metagenome TaxID=412755 RepID=A0A0F9MHS8_9ZZZZ
MPIDYSVNALLTSVKQRSMNANNQNLFENSDIIRIASEELQGTILPYIESVKHEYYVTHVDLTFRTPTGGVLPQRSEVTKYDIPQRATGTKLRDVSLVDFQDNEVLLNYINPEDLKSSWAYAPYQFGFYPIDYSIQIVLGNNLGAGNYKFVRMIYFRRPNTLCPTGVTGNAGQVVSFDTGAKTITLNAAPTMWTLTTQFDIVNSNPPFQARGEDLVINGLAGFVLTFVNDLPTGLTVGDWVSEANFSPIPQMPVECHRLLEALAAARILQYGGDPAFQVMQVMAENMKEDLIQILSPRVDGSPQKIPIRNRLWGGW